MKRNITLAVLLISLLAVGAYAQTEGEPVKEQSRQDGSENAANPENGTANQNHEEYENAKPGEAHDPSGPAGSTGQGEVNQGDKVLDADKDGELALDRNYGEGDGNNHELGDNRRNGDEFDGEGGPHGPTGVDLGPDKVGEDCDGDMTRERKFGDGEDGNHELGEGHRRGGEFEGEGGPHGPMGSGSESGLLKIFGEDADGLFAGHLNQHSWGPGTSETDGPFGPNRDVGGFGPGSRDAVDGKTDPAMSTRGQRRSGRR